MGYLVFCNITREIRIIVTFYIRRHRIFHSCKSLEDYHVIIGIS